MLSAPSGAGKTTLCQGLRQNPDFCYSVSCTTRTPRPGEVDGRDYFFLSKEDFQERVERGEFLEHALVHGNYYGTLRETVLKNLEQGTDVLIDIDTQGAAMIRANAHGPMREALADVFLMPPSMEELSRRLNKRGTEKPEQVALRLRNAVAEMKAWREYRYTIISGSAPEDLENFRAIMRAERQTSKRLSLDFI